MHFRRTLSVLTAGTIAAAGLTLTTPAAAPAQAETVSPDTITAMAVDEAKKQGDAQDYSLPLQKPVRKILFLGLTDVTTGDGVRHTLSADYRTWAKNIMGQFESLTESTGMVDVVPTLKFDDGPVKLGAGDNKVHEWGIADALNRASGMAEYDAIMPFYNENAGGATFPGYYDDRYSRGAGYSFWSLLNAGDASKFPGLSQPVEYSTDIALHEFSHQLEFNNLGYAYPAVHDSEKYPGLTCQPDTRCSRFYLASYSGEVPSAGKHIGFFPKMWATSPRFLHRPAMATVHYQDDLGRTIAPDANLYGPGGDAYSLPAPPAIDGYGTPKLASGSAPASGTFTTGTRIDITYVYTGKPAALVTVRHLKSDGTRLARDVTIAGTVGAPYDARPVAVNGWHPQSTPANATGTFGTSAVTVAYVYEKDSAPVTVRHVDVNGVPLAPDTTLTGAFGAAYTATPVTLDGWEVKRTPGNATGVFRAGPITVTFVYKRNPAPAAPVTVRHVDRDGRAIAPDATLTGTVGAAYTATPVTVDGWRVKRTPANATGAFRAGPITVTFVYTR
ncbi:MucBP domain-containing protein [Leifsonia virtsii]|uniref:MucBP domain-containing protein n=1 Tax=Leifsonia virtsii TaxID=3035915 RepID=A0ABT8J146_9MICO|nr:MucBP domain-containing protein [Leifsonia virtsii]MDN4598804.1 MucBP domain-containing protein [Leifsonia virtsii]